MRCLLLIVLLAISVSLGDCGACLTRAGAYGKCVNIKRCKPVMKLLKSRPPMSVYNELRHEHCGFDGDDPKICCELQIKPTDRLNSILESSLPASKPEPVKSPVDPHHPKLRLLEADICGPVAVEARIYGGSTTRLFEFPWMALLAYETIPNFDGSPDNDVAGADDDDKPGPDFRCAATIINKKYLLTAAHCVSYLSDDLKFVGVRVGEHNLAKERDCEIYDNGARFVCAEKYQDFRIERVVAHPEYSPTTLQNDIALIRINGTMNFKPPSVRPICLPLDSSSHLSPGDSGLVTGWGTTEADVLTSTSAMSQLLLKVRLPVQPTEACARAYRDQLQLRLSRQKQICAGGQRGKDSCSGDSGGPLQTVEVRRGEVRVVQHGIVSFGRRKCAVEGSPGVYTNVGYYLDWILRSIEE